MGQVDDFKGELCNDRASPFKQEGEQTHYQKCEQPQQSTVRDDDQGKQDTCLPIDDKLAKESELPHMHIQEEEDARSVSLEETKTESSASGPNIETFDILKQITVS